MLSINIKSAGHAVLQGLRTISKGFFPYIQNILANLAGWPNYIVNSFGVVLLAFSAHILSCASIVFDYVRSHVKLGVSLRVLYYVVDTGYGLGRSLRDCRPALPKGPKYQIVKTQTESHVRRPIV